MISPSLARFQAILAMSLLFCGTASSQDSRRTASVNDSAGTAMLINHLRANIDDIHDVSMRFHHLDHRLNGLIRIDMHWADGRMTSSSVATNETNSRAFADALVARLKMWHIEDLAGDFDISLPLRIRIVGSDDSTFSEKGILTGVIRDRNGAPVRDATLEFRSAADPSDTLRTCHSNREGVFVKTLIPVGKWDVECRAKGFERVVLRNVGFRKGAHLRRTIALQRLE